MLASSVNAFALPVAGKCLVGIPVLLNKLMALCAIPVKGVAFPVADNTFVGIPVELKC